MATTAVPPALGVPLPVDADGSTDGAVDASVDGAVVAAGGAVGAVLVAAPPQAANTIAVTAKSAPIRTCFMLPPPPVGSPVTCVDENPSATGDPDAAQDSVGPRPAHPASDGV
jgi:hypothetical protein